MCTTARATGNQSYKIAEKEHGAPIDYNPKPLIVREIMEPDIRQGLSNQLERGHNELFLYECSINPGYVVPSIVDGVELR